MPFIPSVVERQDARVRRAFVGRFGWEPLRWDWRGDKEYWQPADESALERWSA